MKKIIYLLTALFFGHSIIGQNFTISTPTNICFNPQGVTIMTASISNTLQGATSYSWTTITGSCAPQFSTAGAPQTNVSYPCCGNYVLLVTAYNASLTVIAQGSINVSVNCSSLVAVANTTVVCAGTSASLSASGASSYTWTGPGGPISFSSSALVTPTGSACYTVTGNNNGCLSQKSICILVQPSPAASVNGPHTACVGDTVLLTASGGGTYAWSTGSSTSTISAKMTSNACFSVVVTNSMNCTSTAVHCVTVGAVAGISGANSVCNGSQISLTGFGATSYTWLPGGSQLSTMLFSPSVTTCYTLLTSGACGTASAIKCVSVNPTPTVGLTVSGGCANTRTLVATGGQSYVWSTNQVGSSIVVSPTTTTCYSVTATNNFNCSVMTSTCLNVQNSGFTVTGPSVVCVGTSATFSASSNGSYTWQPGSVTGTSLVVTPTVSSCYTVTGTFTSGCTQTIVKCVTLVQNPTLTTSNNGICQGGTGVLTVSGASTYTWVPYNSTGANVVVSSTTTPCYTVTGTSAAGCIGTVSTCFSVVPSPTVTASSNVTICPGVNATLSAAGATTYSWIPGNFSTPNIVVSPTISTCYTVTGMSGSCNDATVICVTVLNAPLTFSNTPTSCVGTSISINAVGPASFTWQPGNLTTSVIVVTPTISTCYTLVATYTNGCSRTAPRCITVNQLPNITTVSNNFCSGNSGSLTASGGTSYTWQPFNVTGSVITVTPSASGCYTVTGTNSNGCQKSTVACYSVFPTPTLAISGPSVLCPGQSATLVASGATTYTWIPGNFTGASIVITPSASTCYTLVGNSSGCTSSAVRCVTVQVTTVTVNGPAAICSGLSATLTASGASGYTWQPGNLTGTNVVVSPASTTCYTVSGTNANGTCVATVIKCMTVSANPTVTTSGGTFCAGSMGGLSASGANSYTWAPFNFTGPNVNITPTVSGCYTVSGTNSAGCVASAVGCYTVNPTPTIGISGNLYVCAGSGTTLTATGANTYTWYPDNITGSSIALTPTANTCYTVIGMSNAGCSKDRLVCVSVQTPTLQISGPPVVCMNSTVTLIAGGAANFVWQPGGLTGSAVAVSPTVSTCYTVTGSSPNGTCTSTFTKCLVVAPVPVVSATSATFCAGQAGTLTASGASSYTWYPFNTVGQAAIITPSVSGCFTVVGADSTGCQSAATNCYSVLPVPSINVSGNNNVCSGNSTTLTAAGAASYTWIPGGLNAPSMIITPTSNICYTVMGSNGFCKNNGIRCVTVQSSTVGINGPGALCGPGSVTLTTSSPGTYTWLPGNLTGPSIVVSPTANTCYTVSGYANSNCLLSAVKCMNVVNSLELTISGTQTICAGQLANITVSGANTYSWSNGSNSNSICVSPPSSTSYFVTGFIGGCATTTAVPVTVYPMPVVSVVSNAQSACAGTPVQLIANGAGTYTWNWSTGQSGNVAGVTPTATTVYTVTGTNSQGCSRSATISISVFGDCTGLEDYTTETNVISLYPNPAAGEVKLSGSNNSIVKFALFDVLGREILRGDFTGTKTINTAAYNNGSYIVRFESGGSISHQRLIINK